MILMFYVITIYHDFDSSLVEYWIGSYQHWQSSLIIIAITTSPLEVLVEAHLPDEFVKI
jgi:hypothetical protein